MANNRRCMNAGRGAKREEEDAQQEQDQHLLQQRVEVHALY